MILGIHLSLSLITGALVDAHGEISEMHEATSENELTGSLQSLFERVARMMESADPGDQLSAIVFDVGDMLIHRTPEALTLLRITPRPPIDDDHEIAIDRTQFGDPNVAYIAGGHTAIGNEIVPFDSASLLRIADSASPNTRYVVTSVGSLIHPAHEIAAERLLSHHERTASVEGSRTFHSHSFAVRERTALMNASLVATAETLGTVLALVSGNNFPGSRLYVTTNEGGRSPLTRLTVTPVHSLLSAHSTDLVGAAAIAGIDNGRLIVLRTDTQVIGEMLDGVPTATPYAPNSLVGRLATPTAHIRATTPSVLSGAIASDSQAFAPPLVVLQDHQTLPKELGALDSQHTSLNLRALGAACSLMTDWVTRFIRIANADEMVEHLVADEARVTARLVAAGATPSKVRIVESHVTATAYEAPNVVAIRVRGVAGTLTRLARPRSSR